MSGKQGANNSGSRIRKLLHLLSNSEKPLSREEIFSNIPEYSENNRGIEAQARMFERDKETLRCEGVNITVEESTIGRSYAYLIRDKRAFALTDLEITNLEELAIRCAISYISSISRDPINFPLFTKLAAIIGDIHPAGITVRAVEYNWPSVMSSFLAAFSAGKQLEFSYKKPGDSAASIRVVSPLRLCQVEKRWHLIGYDHSINELRVFLIRRCGSDLRVTDNPALKIPDTEIKKAEIELLDLASKNQVTFNVQKLAEIADKLTARVPHPAVISASLETAGDSNLIKCGTADYKEFAQQLLATGRDEAVVDPPEFLDLLRQRHATAVELNRGRADEYYKLQKLVTPLRQRKSGKLSEFQLVALSNAVLRVLASGYAMDISRMCDKLLINRETLLKVVDSINKDYFFDGVGVRISGKDDALIIDGATNLDLALFNFNDDEINLLIDSLTAVSEYFSSELKKAAESAKSKILNLSNSGEAAGSHVKILNGKESSDPVTENLSAIYRALDLNEYGRLEFRYSKDDGSVSERSTVPLNLIQNNEKWLLEAYCLQRNAKRVFRVDLMSNLKVSEDYSEFYPNINSQADALQANKAAQTKVRFAITSGFEYLLTAYNPVFYKDKLERTSTVIPGAETLRERTVVQGVCDLWNSSGVRGFISAGCGELEILDPPEIRELAHSMAAAKLAAMNSPA